MKITNKDVQEYFKTHKISTYKDFAKEFDISSVWAREILRGRVNSSLNFKGKYITLIDNKKSDKYGIIKIGDLIFSKNGSIRTTLLYLIKTYNNITSKEIYSILGINPSQQLTILLKKRIIFTKKEGRTYQYSLSPFSPEIIEKEEFSIQSLCERDKVLQYLEIIRLVKSGKKKTDVAQQFKISSKTVANICNRFEQGQTKALVKQREAKAYKITKPIEAAIITEAMKHPDKSPSQLANILSSRMDFSVKTIKKVLEKFKPALEIKKKILLELPLPRKQPPKRKSK